MAAALIAVAELVEEAEARAGPFPGDVPFRDTLELLLRSCARTASLNDTGQDVLHRTAVRRLRNLRALQDFVAARPDVAGLPLGSPVVVTGVPRTGTTLLHNLLALDPAHRPLRLWEALHPVPAEAGGPSVAERQAQARRWVDGFHRLVPGFRGIHSATADGPEECDALLQNTFASQHFDDMFDAEEYSAWLGSAPLTAEYEHYALELRALSLSSPPGSTWVLKSPGHLAHLDALAAALPGCTVVVCHRDPREAVASYASLVQTLRAAYSDHADPVRIGRQALGRTARAAAGIPARTVGVPYRRLVAEPVEAVREVYAQLGRGLDPAVEASIAAWVAAHPRHGHGAHRYDLARFGLTGEEVDRAFGPYLDRFGPLVAG